jgi:hypothetical protein
MAKRKRLKIVWKETVYCASKGLNFNLLEEVSRTRMRKKGLKELHLGLEQCCALYKWSEEGAVIYLSRKDVNTVFLKIETYLHEFLHHLTHCSLPTTIETFIDDLIDLLL